MSNLAAFPIHGRHLTAVLGQHQKFSTIQALHSMVGAAMANVLAIAPDPSRTSRPRKITASATNIARLAKDTVSKASCQPYYSAAKAAAQIRIAYDLPAYDGCSCLDGRENSGHLDPFARLQTRVADGGGPASG